MEIISKGYYKQGGREWTEFSRLRTGKIRGFL
jgi:hypothetical protein